MKLAMIGFGQAGGKIVDKFVGYDAEQGSNIVRAAVAVNTAKADLPQKICAACGRPFSWRKKWARDWDQVKYCSKRCGGA